MRHIHRVLQRIGAELAVLGIFLAMFLLFLGLPVVGIAAAFYAAFFTMEVIGGGAFTLFGGWFVLTLFLSIYVWDPHIRPAVVGAVELLTAATNKIKR